MHMLVPDFWKGRGRYSKQATMRKVKEETPYHPSGDDGPKGEK